MRPKVIGFHSRPVTQVKFSKDGKFLFTSSKDKLMTVWDTVDWKLLGTYDGHEGAISSFELTHDEKFLVTVAQDFCVRIFEVNTGRVLLTLEGKSPIKGFDWTSTDQYKFIVARDKYLQVPREIVVYEFTVDDQKNTLCTPSPITSPNGPNGDWEWEKLTQIKFGPRDSTFVCSDEKGNLFKFDAAAVGGSLLKKIEAHQKKINQLLFNKGRSFLFTASSDMTCKMFSYKNLDILKQFTSDRPLNTVSVYPKFDVEGEKLHLICAGGQDAKDVTTTAGQEGQFETCFFHLAFQEEIGRVRGHFGPIHTVQFFPNCQGFVTGGEDGNVRVNFFDKDYLEGDTWDE